MGFTEHQLVDEIGEDFITIVPAAGLLAIRGPLLPIRVELPEEARRILLRMGTLPSAPIEGLALIDTGRMTSVIDESVCLELGAREVAPSGFARLTSLEETLLYTLKVSFEGNWTLPVVFPAMATADLGFHPPDSRLLCIFGRDFLADKMMIYNGRRGRFELHN
jgi:hypothetical protein